MTGQRDDRGLCGPQRRTLPGPRASRQSHRQHAHETPQRERGNGRVVAGQAEGNTSY